ncbi:FtsW/RodA/SpoVE family cell cycle protein [Helcococcus ovis]|uniref:Rod shape-determining protein RodA n=1 Tax=Helcococcus ovis TaxID=72026 RepID=A0A4R9C2Q5_9FIRM|nr:FtsW/RodA/SpoVE family cell cycle protein [Helcococcus ovis]TFF64826.1 rod shape-determining protein RodA [Helcococcus ovis]TFF65854.1 rod shape-determining protein RodA [Helcococcus ovis]TFF67810.1 rod shape-determining protein RodA [Helcococcus ovis]WNZ01074.1 FtsW/RodA/SpoVE family cell cycle protein [Helcococcus ovis]
MFNFSWKNIKKLDFILLFSLIILVVFGLVVLNAAITPVGRTIKSQIISTIFGFIGMGFIFILNLDIFKKLKWLIYIVSVGLILMTIFFGYGGDSWGANLWLRIGPINLQPSEISKVLHILFLSILLGENKNNINSWKFIFKYLILALFPVGLIIVQRDLGTAMVVLFIVVSMLFVSGLKWKKIGILLGVAILALVISLPFIWSNLAGYAKDRILDFKDSSRNLSTSTHQTDRGLIALGSGQLLGRGYKSGPFSQNRYIPEQHTDFIFPVLVEDFGFLGGAFAMLLYFIIFTRMVLIAYKSDDLYHTTFVIGVLALLFVHVFENMGMTMKIMPVTGIPLPFFSHGGTFQLINLLLMGFVLSISMNKKSLEF